MHSNPRKTARSPDSSQHGTSPSKQPRHEAAFGLHDSRDPVFQDAVILPLSSPVVSMPGKRAPGRELTPNSGPGSQDVEKTPTGTTPPHVYAVVNVTNGPLPSAPGSERRDGVGGDGSEVNNHQGEGHSDSSFHAAGVVGTEQGARPKVPMNSDVPSYATPSAPSQSRGIGRDRRDTATPRKKLFANDLSGNSSSVVQNSHESPALVPESARSTSSALNVPETFTAPFSFRPRRCSADLLDDVSDMPMRRGERESQRMLRDIAVSTEDFQGDPFKLQNMHGEQASARTISDEARNAQGLGSATAVAETVQSNKKESREDPTRKPSETGSHQTPCGVTPGAGNNSGRPEELSRDGRGTATGAEGGRLPPGAEGTSRPPIPDRTQRTPPVEGTPGASGAERDRRPREGFATPAALPRSSSQDSAFSYSEGSRRASRTSTATPSLAGSRQTSLDSSSPSPQGEEGAPPASRSSRVADVVRRVVNARMSAFEERLAARLDGRLARMEARMAAVEDSVDRLRESVQGLTDVLI